MVEANAESSYGDEEGWDSDDAYGQEELPILEHKESESDQIFQERFKLFDKSEVRKRQRLEMNKVINNLQVSESIAAALLIKYGWSEKKVMNAFLNDCDLI